VRGSKPVWLVVAAIILPLSAAHGLERKGVIRTFVSGLGNDANTAAFCSRPKPCRTLAAAYTVTEVGGEIVALDPGEFGPITIAGRLSIFGTQNALIGVATGGTGVTINAGAGDRIIIKDLIISGAGGSNTKGIQLNSGQLALSHSAVVENDTGITTTGTGVDTNVFPLTGPTQVRIAWGNAIGNTKAYVMNNPGTGSGGNKITIFEFLTSNTTAAYSTNMTGNATLVSGTGASCGGTNCQSLGYYSSYTNLN
jgi:hypothetical protein